MNLRELKETRAAKVDALAAAVDDGETFAALDTEVRELDEKIARAERVAEAERAGAARAETRGPDEGEAEVRAFLRGEARAMATSGGPEGGYLVPEQLDRTILRHLQDLTPMRRVARVVSTTSQDFRTLVAKTGASSGWVHEHGARTETDEPTLGMITPYPGELYARPTVTQHLLEDAAFDVQTFVADHVATEFAFQEGEAFVRGDGIAKPTGFLQSNTTDEADGVRAFGTLQHVVTGSAAGLGTSPADTLINLMTTLRPIYRQGPGVAWMMNSTTAGELRRLKDGDGRYLWQDSLAEGVPNRLLGYPVVESEGMPAIAAGEYPIAFGNWRRGYIIADRRGTRMIRDELTKPGFVRYYFSRRVGGAVVDSNAIKLLQVAAS